MDAWLKANKDVLLLIMGGIFYAILLYEIWKGEFKLSSSKNSTSLIISRKTHPVIYWVGMAIQFILITGLRLVFYFQV